jgi:hypothetical protein
MPFSSKWSLFFMFSINTLFSDTLILRFSIHVGDRLSHPHKTTCKIIVLYLSIFKFLDNKLYDKDSAPNNNNHSFISVCS